MKKGLLTFILLFTTLSLNGQTVNFDTDANWTAGSGILTSYQSDHQYNTTISGFAVNFTGGPALRETAGTQDGFPRTYTGSTYAWRLRDASVTWIVTISATSINGFSFRVRRWDGSPSPNFDVAFSSDGGTAWTSVGTINNTFLGNSSDWSLFSYNNSISGTPNIQIRLQATATTERIMIDDFTIDNPLPVELSSFSASVVGNAVKLNWRTETEVNNYGFEIERYALSAERQAWEKIGFVEGYGNSNSPKSYSFTDSDVLPGKYNYRLKQIDNDGQFEYSKIIEVDLGAPNKFELAQNYPNPFNPETSIRFTLPNPGNVRLTIYNLLGQEVHSLVNEYKEAGTHIINFNASDFNSGVYIYKLEANGVTQTRKMTLIK